MVQGLHINLGGSDNIQRDNTQRDHITVQPTHESEQPLQEVFKIIQDSVSRTRLPPELRLNDSGGVKRKAQPIFNVIRKCARYTETVLKLISHVDQNNGTSQRVMDDIQSCLVAEMRYLQEEYTGIVVTRTIWGRCW